MADLIERASAINALQYVLDSPNYSKALGEILRIPTADTPQTENVVGNKATLTIKDGVVKVSPQPDCPWK